MQYPTSYTRTIEMFMQQPARFSDFYLSANSAVNDGWDKRLCAVGVNKYWSTKSDVNVIGLEVEYTKHGLMVP